MTKHKIATLPFRFWIPMWLIELPEETPVWARSKRWAATGKRTDYGLGLWMKETQIMVLFNLNECKNQIGAWRFKIPSELNRYER